MGEGLKRARAAARATRADPRDAIIDECAKCVPTNWLDSLLSGPDGIRGLPPRQTEELLRRIQDRIRSLKTSQ